MGRHGRGSSPRDAGRWLVPHPNLLATRAITIQGQPEEIWPWVAQIGYRRAGFYGYDLIENLGSPLGIRSAGTILPEFQHPAPGERVYMSAVAYLVFDAVAPNRYLTWKGVEDPPGGEFTWALYPLDETHTRLVCRTRLQLLQHWADRRAVLDGFTEIGDPVAVRKVLEGVRDRVEGRPLPPLGWQAAEIAVWVLALAELAVALVFLFRWKRWLRAWPLALAATGVLFLALYADQPVWIPGLAGMAVAVLLWRAKAADSRRLLHLAAVA